QRPSARGEEYRRPPVGLCGECCVDDIGPQHHSRPAPERCVIDAAVPVGRKIPNIPRAQRPKPTLERPPRQRGAERPREHIRTEGEDGGAPAHAAASEPSATSAGGTTTIRSA